MAQLTHSSSKLHRERGDHVQHLCGKAGELCLRSGKGLHPLGLLPAWLVQLALQNATSVGWELLILVTQVTWRALTIRPVILKTPARGWCDSQASLSTSAPCGHSSCPPVFV